MPTDSEAQTPVATNQGNVMGAASASVISGLSPKDKALAGAALLVITGVLSWFNQGIQEDVSSMKTSNAVMVEKLGRIEDSIKDSYTKTEATSALDRQKEVDYNQTKAIEKISDLLDEHLRSTNG